MYKDLNKVFSARLTKELILYLFLFSLLFSCIYTAFELRNKYEKKKVVLESSFIHIENRMVEQLSFSLWYFDNKLLEIQLKDMMKLPGVSFVEIVDNNRILQSFGKRQISNFSEQSIVLTNNSNGVQEDIGTLYVQVSYNKLDKEVFSDLKDVIKKEFIRFFLLTFLLLYIVYKLIIRHLLHMAEYTRKVSIETLSEPLVLDKKVNKNSLDELDHVIKAINKMRKNILLDITLKEEARKELLVSNSNMEKEINERIKVQKKIDVLNEELEKKVYERTEELEESNEELQTTIYNLKNTQNQLIQSEKMAGLATIVAGVAHEVNTPLGISLTAATHLDELSRKVKEDYKNENLTEEEFIEFLEESNSLSTIINKNIERSANLIRSFKKVAVDQSSEVKRKFDLVDYIDEVLLSIGNITKKRKIKIEVDAIDSIVINSYPGSFAQIITNLVMNSFNHGFSKDDEGLIRIKIRKDNNKLKLTYSDNGKGIKKENLNNIFNPFFTTNRAHGGSGLGLNIIYNIISTTLNGTISCESQENEGVLFNIKIDIGE